MSKAIYAGSFDPFTNGHLDILKTACNIFDEVYLLLCDNAKKKRMFDVWEMKDAIIETLKAEKLDNVFVFGCDGLVVEFARKKGIKYLIRGLRNNTDYNYEENIATVNTLLNPEIKHIYFRADNVAISSSMVKELMSYGKDIQPYVPTKIYEYLK